MEVLRPSEPSQMWESYQEAVSETKILLGQHARDLVSGYMARYNPEALPRIDLPGAKKVQSKALRGILVNYETLRVGSDRIASHTILAPKELIVISSVVDEKQSDYDIVNWRYLELTDKVLQNDEEDLALFWMLYGPKALQFLAHPDEISPELRAEKARLEHFN